ncbi:hypothetical protein MAR_020620, partial [Mya arenaria]
EAAAAPTDASVSECGNTGPNVDTVAVYRRVRPTEIKRAQNVANQGECFAYNLMTDTWAPGDCGIQTPFLCLSKQCAGPINQCIVNGNAANTWYGARAQCETIGYLAPVNVTLSATFQDRVVLGNPNYWTGLHRKEIVVWNYDDNSSQLERSDRCFAVAKRPDGSWEWRTDSCRNQVNDNHHRHHHHNDNTSSNCCQNNPDYDVINKYDASLANCKH